MSASSQEISRREAVARAHIDAVYGTPEDEFGVTLFVSHHLSELEASYWLKHTGTSTPDAQEVLRLLEVCFNAEEEDLEEEEEPLDTLDFSLPDNVTNYLICVEFDNSGNVTRVAMES